MDKNTRNFKQDMTYIYFIFHSTGLNVSAKTNIAQEDLCFHHSRHTKRPTIPSIHETIPRTNIKQSTNAPILNPNCAFYRKLHDKQYSTFDADPLGNFGANVSNFAEDSIGVRDRWGLRLHT